MTSTCLRCGHELEVDDFFCALCGAPTDGDETAHQRDLVDLAEALDADDELATSIASLPPATALLVVRKGPNAPSRYFLGAVTTMIGRNPECDVFLDDLTVSRRHAVIRREGACYLIEDLASLNGTYVGGERAETSYLEHLCEIRIGAFTLVFIHAEAQVHSARGR